MLSDAVHEVNLGTAAHMRQLAFAASVIKQNPETPCVCVLILVVVLQITERSVMSTYFIIRIRLRQRLTPAKRNRR